MKEYRFLFKGKKSNLYYLKKKKPKSIEMNIHYNEQGNTELMVKGSLSDYTHLYLYCKAKAEKAFILEQTKVW